MAKRIMRADGGVAWAGDVLRLLGVKRLPDEGLAEREVQGVRVFVKAKPVQVERCRVCDALCGSARVPCPGCGSVVRWRRRHMVALRVMARCECGRVVPVGRLAQHKCGSGRKRG